MEEMKAQAKLGNSQRYDNMHMIFKNGLWEGKIVKTLITSENGLGRPSIT